MKPIAILRSVLAVAALMCVATATYAQTNPGLVGANRIYAGPTTGTAAVPTFRPLVSADMPVPLILNNSGFPLPSSTIFGRVPVIVFSGAQDADTQGETLILADTFGFNSNATYQVSKSGGGGDFLGGTAGLPSTTITITSTTAGSSANGQVVMVAGCPAGTTITSGGGTSTWTVSNTCTVAAATLILTNDDPTFPTPTLGAQGIGFFQSSGWYNNGSAIVRTNQTAAMRFYSVGCCTASDWSTQIDFFVTAVGSTVMGGGGLGTAVLTLFPDGSGRTGGSMVQTLLGIGTGQADGLVLQNTTLAANGAQQDSPTLKIRGQGWKTATGGASQPVDFGVTTVPTQGSSAPTGNLVVGAQVNGGGFNVVASFSTGGVFNVVTGFTIAGASAPLGHVLRGNSTNYVDGQVAFSELTGSLACSQHPALTGDVTTSAGSCATVVGNIPTGVTQGGYIEATEISAPSNPSAGKVRIYAATTDNLKVQNSAGAITTTVVPISAVSHQFLTALNNSGVFSQAQPSFSDLSGSATCAQLPALTGDTTSSAGSCGTTTTKINSVDQTTAWTTYTPTPSCGTGTFTSATASGRSKTLGKQIFFEVKVVITTNGACASFIVVPLPVNAQASSTYAAAGFRDDGLLVAGSFTTVNINIFKYDGTYPGADGRSIWVSGIYESN